MESTRAAYDEIYVYAMQRPWFILQHVVDASAIQGATRDSKPIAVVFGLIGLYLRVEKQFSGRQVQLVHKKLAARKRAWPRIDLPEQRGEFTVFDVRRVPAGPQRDMAIDFWCRSVWASVANTRPSIISLLEDHGIVESKAQ